MNIKSRNELWKLIEVSGNAAEIGVAEGLFAENILNWPTNFPRLYLVDRWLSDPNQKGDGGFQQSWHDTNFKQVVELSKKYGNRVHILRGDSSMVYRYVLDAELAFLNIDADHSYQAVLADLERWVPKVKPGGIVALHDYVSPDYGVGEAAREFCAGKYELHDIPENGPDAGAWFRC